MANLLEQYGIKEVADVTFYDLKTKLPVLFLDTLKVSTIEQTAEQTEARGGKGNPPLIIWDYGKEITLNIEDALYSPQSMALIFGDKDGVDGTVATITRMKKHVADGAVTLTAGAKTIASKNYTVNYYYHDDAGVMVSLTTGTTTITDGQTYYEERIRTDVKGNQIVIDANSFPGTYRVVGETFSRNAKTGEDTYFQFEIPRAKMNSEQTITLEAEGDPTVFNMSLRVLRDDDGQMMKLTQYDLSEKDWSWSDKADTGNQ